MQHVAYLCQIATYFLACRISITHINIDKLHIDINKMHVNINKLHIEINKLHVDIHKFHLVRWKSYACGQRLINFQNF
jgi:hypothetical protein